MSIDNTDDLSEEFPSLNPTIVENFDDKGFCEPYKGSICSGIITSNYSVYSTSANQQDLIEERLRTIIPLLASNKHSLSKRCSTFAIPSLCLFAFPLCDKQTKQPKQICRFDCKQLQQDICKNEYFNVKLLFESSKVTDNLQHQSSNFLLDCNQLPPSSDSPSDCLPIVTMTLDKLESQVIAINNNNNQQHQESISVSVPAIQPQEQCLNLNGIDYHGMQSFTRNGYQCQKWPDSFVNTNPELSGHNYCRNIDNDIEPWCFTTNPQQRKDYCNIPKCRNTNNNIIISEQSFDQSNLFNLKKMSVLLYIIVPSVSLSFVFIILTLCYCRRNRNNNNNSYVTKSINAQTTAAILSSVQPPIIPPPMSNTLFQQNSRLRMSNASIGKKKHNQQQQQHQIRSGSSKSSVASSAVNNPNLELNPFLKQNYDAQIFNFNQQQQQYLIQQQQQHQTDYSTSVKQVSSNNIRYLQEIGKGRFGPVYIGELVGTYANVNNSVIKTVIKTLNNKPNKFLNDLNLQTTSTPNVNACFQQQQQHHNNNAEAHFNEQEFYNEISLYSTLHNRYLANLIGVHTTNKISNNEDEDDCISILNDNLAPQCMIFEHLNNGDLHEYLLQRVCCNTAGSAGGAGGALYNGIMMAGSQSNLSAASSIGGASSNYLNLQQQQRNIADFLYIGQQIASGMEYLASQNFILKDLATRNILMSDNLTVKISIDLIAQYKELYSKDYYKFQSKMLPVRWMSPESLLYGRCTQQSDVWSYGVCLWEIFNYGCQPYSGCTNPEAIEMIRDRQLLLIPDECPQRAYALMLECWHENPMQRPTFTEIISRLRNWENYYLFNNNNNNTNQSGQVLSIHQQQLPPPLPLPLHLQQQQQQQTIPSFQMSSSYSSNSQNSKASSLLGNTASTGISTSCSPPPPPLPPPIGINNNHHNQLNMCYSPSKNGNTALFASKFQNNHSNTNIYRGLEASNSLRMSQRNFNCNMPNSFNNIPINNNHMDNNNHQFDL